MKKLLLFFFIVSCALARGKATSYETDKKHFMDTYGMPLLNYTSATISGTKALVGIYNFLKDNNPPSGIHNYWLVYSMNTATSFALGIASARTNAHTKPKEIHKNIIIPSNLVIGAINTTISLYGNPFSQIDYLMFGITGSIQIATALYKYFYQKSDTI